MKKSLEELEIIRNTVIDQINMRTGKEGYKIVVSMGTCGIAAGARSVIIKFMEQLEKHELTNVTLAQIDCINQCKDEPIVEVCSQDGEKVIYIKMDEAKVEKVVADHIIGGNIVHEYTTS